eukprot:8577026-Lingulodinium_polyedra.AAC.1
MVRLGLLGACNAAQPRLRISGASARGPRRPKGHRHASRHGPMPLGARRLTGDLVLTGPARSAGSAKP